MNHRIIILVVLVVCAGLAFFALKRNQPATSLFEQQSLEVGGPAPGFTLEDLDGRSISLSDLRGKVVLLNIWATWCPPCIEEMPSMEKLHQRFAGRDFVILAVSIDEGGAAAVRPFMMARKLSFSALLDPQASIKSLYRATAVPESFVIDKQGNLVKKFIGAIDWSTPEVYRFIEDLVQSPSIAS